MKTKRSKRSVLILSTVTLLVILFLTQLQPALLQIAGAVDGTFGLRPTTHKCAGVTLSGEWIAAHLRPADRQGTFGLFRVRYFVPEEAGGRDFCFGQDLWYGE